MAFREDKPLFERLGRTNHYCFCGYVDEYRVKNTQGEKSRAEIPGYGGKIRSARHRVKNTQGEKYTRWKIHRVKNPGRKLQGRVKNTQGEAQGEKYAGCKKHRRKVKIRSARLRVKNTQGVKYTGAGWKIHRVKNPRPKFQGRVKNTQSKVQGEKYTGWKIHRLKFQGRVKNTQGEKYTGWIIRRVKNPGQKF